MRIIGVLDLQEGVGVHGRQGRRDLYCPVRSPFTQTGDPREIAQGYREFGIGELYLADLDAINGQPRQEGVYSNLIGLGFHLNIDCGVRSAACVQPMLNSNWDLVIGLETISSLDELRTCFELSKASGRQKSPIFSVDLYEGKPIGHAAADFARPQQIIDLAYQWGIARFLLLDLSRIGTGAGIGAERLVTHLRRRSTEIEILVGGGIGNMDQLLRLRDLGVDGVLLATAIHHGLLRPADLIALA